MAPRLGAARGPRARARLGAALRAARRAALLTVLAALAPRGALAVDRSKFRTCDQGSFCRRYRKYAARVLAGGGAEFAHALEPGSVQHRGHAVSARIVQVHDEAVRPLRLEVKFFLDAVRGRCGVVRVRVEEEAPLHPRFGLREGDVVAREAELLVDKVTVTSPAGGGETLLSAAAPGGCSVALRHRPLELTFGAGGRTLQRLNARRLLNFERYRDRAAAPHKGLVDATDVDSDGLWEESFGGHSDSKPRGPAAVALDVAFEGARVLAGLAEHAAGLNLGQNGFAEPYRFYNLDVFEYALDVPMALYGAVPLVTAAHFSAQQPAVASGFFFANPSEGFVQVDPPTAEGSHTWWAFESGVLDTFLFAGPSAEAVLQQYHTVTGWPRLPPLCTLGKHQSRWNYIDVADSLGVSRKFDQHDIPFDVLWLDIEHTDGKKYFTWHPSHFAKPGELLDALNRSKRKLVTIVDPHIKRDTGYDVFNKIKSQDFFTKTKSGVQYDGWCWPGTSLYPDFCDPAMREQWAKFFSMSYYPHNRRDLYTWNDMNEPSVFNGPEVTMPRDNLHKCHTGSYQVEHRDVHNAYGFYHHMATVQGQLERAPEVRPFVLTRSFFAGSHRHGPVWTGDNMARWDHLARSVPMLLALALCGLSFAGADVPGFFYNPEPELFRRWHQLGIWYPFYRAHAHLETKRREPWTLGDDVTAMVRAQVTARYQLLPTWYTLFAGWAAAGSPILRPLWYHNLDDEEAYRHSNDHFLVGAGILVRAVTEAQVKSLKVYLPQGEWYDFWDAASEPLTGGRVAEVPADVDHVPVFVRSGSILFKKMRRRRSTGAMAFDPYTVVVYGPGKASGRLYVDDGESHEYHKGSFLHEELTFDGATLIERPAPPLVSFGAAKGLPDDLSRHLRVERLVFVGLPRRPRSARSRAAPPAAAAAAAGGAAATPAAGGNVAGAGAGAGGGPGELLQVTSKEVRGGRGWVATVKKPTRLLGTAWSLELSY